MKLGSEARQWARILPGFQVVNVCLGFLMFVSSWFVTTVAVFMRRDMGERYISNINILFGLFGMGLFTGLGGLLISYLTGEPPSGLMSDFMLAYVVLCIYHRRRMKKRIADGLLWHSYFPGFSHVEKVNSKNRPWIKQLHVWAKEGITYRWIEPAAVIVLAYIMRELHHTPVALWLFVSGIALLIHEQTLHYFERQRVLDAVDAMIEGNYSESIIKGTPAEPKMRFFMARSNADLMRSVADMKTDPFETLAPEWSGVIDREKEEASV